MPKRSTDLLEVFNRKPQSRRTPQRASKKSRSRGTKKMRGSFEGLVLGPRQLLLSSCVLVLLLVLSFVVGVGLGRQGDQDPSSASPALSREQQTAATREVWYIRGRTVRVHQVRGDVLDRARIYAELGLESQHVHAAEARGGYYDVYVGPFPTEATARRYWADAGLDTRGRRIGFPFALPGYVRRSPFPDSPR